MRPFSYRVHFTFLEIFHKIGSLGNDTLKSLKLQANKNGTHQLEVYKFFFGLR